MAVVQLRYFTDPASAWSWALEPSLRRLQHELGDELSIVYVMCGIAREFGGPKRSIGEWLAAGEDSGMPVDARLWLEGAPSSSYPACIAVKAAAEQGLEAPYLRRLREGLMCRRRKLDVTETLVEEARAVPGLDLERFRLALASHATLEAFGADLEQAASVPEQHRDPESGRVTPPALEFRGRDGDAVASIYGYCDYHAVEAGARSVGADSPCAAPLSVEEALRSFGSLATVEVAALCQLPGPRAAAELWRLATEWRVVPERLGSGELWRLA